MPSRVATSSPAPPSASRASRSPAVSSSRTRSVITPNVGPASISLTIRNVVAPVTSSPAQTECCTGAAPRHAGRHEKCRLTQPCSGMSRALCGSRAPYATTGQQSGRRSRSAAWNSGSRGWSGLRTGTPSSAASCATGLGVSFRPRPAGASGLVTTPTSSCARVGDRLQARQRRPPAYRRRPASPVTPTGRLGALRAHIARTSLRCRRSLIHPTESLAALAIPRGPRKAWPTATSLRRLALHEH